MHLGGCLVFIVNYKSVSWWYFLATVIALTVGMAGFQVGFFAAIGVTVVHLVHFAIRERGLTSFSMQVRWGLLLFLLLGQVEPLRWLNWIPTVGIWVQCLFGYCTMARIMSVMPWIKQEPYSLGLLRRTFLSPPVPGNIFQVAAKPADPSAELSVP